MKRLLIGFCLVLALSVPALADRFYVDPTITSSRQSEYRQDVYYYYRGQANGDNIPVKSSTGATLWGWYYDADGNILKDAGGKNIAGSYTMHEPIYDSNGVAIPGGFNLSPETLEGYSLQSIKGVR